MEKQVLTGRSPQEVLRDLGTRAQGLTLAEVSDRRARYGPNALRGERGAALRILGRQFRSSLIYVLIVAALLAFASQDLSDGVIITAILLINAGLGFRQEYHSARAVEKLARLISATVQVRRDGVPARVAVAELVPGDIVLLEEGDVVPADIVLLAADHVQVDESQLTGESVPVPKEARPSTATPVPAGPVSPAPAGSAGSAHSAGAAASAAPSCASPFRSTAPAATAATAAAIDACLLFAGSTMEQGSATGAVYAIGNDTQLGKIAALSSSIHRATQYEKSLRSLSTLLLKIIGVSLAVTAALKIILGGLGGSGSSLTHLPLLVIFIIALAVAVVPEALPVVATLTLSRGALRLAREQVVVKRLSALEDLGNITLLCTDKTGTLTENALTIQRLVSPDAALFQRLACATMHMGAEERTARAGTAGATSRVTEGTAHVSNEGRACVSTEGTARVGTQSAFDAAFAAYIPDDGKRQATAYAQLCDLPFDPSARRRRVVLRDRASGTTYLVVIGAAETLLELSTGALAPQYRQQLVAEGQQGLRHLAMAYKEIAYTDGMDILSQEHDLTFLGVVTLADPLRPSIPQALATARQLGVAIKILTGDSVEVAAYVARQLGLLSGGGRVYSGDELAHLPPDQRERAVAQGSVFARVSPEQKFAIMQALQKHAVVGYQGDGINDAPALKLADVGIAVDSATDVAKASADIILLNKDLGVLINGITYGRTVFTNINKYIKYTMVGNFGNLLALGVLYLLSTDLPLLPRQVLLLSLLTDLPLVTISTDTVSTADLERPAQHHVGALLSLSLVLGTLTALFELAFVAALHLWSAASVQTSLYVFLSLTQLIVILSIRNKGHFWTATTPSRWLLGGVALTAVLTLALPYAPLVAPMFSFSALSPIALGAIVLVVLVYLVVLDMVKVWYYRAAAGRQTEVRFLGTTRLSHTSRPTHTMGVSYRQSEARDEDHTPSAGEPGAPGSEESRWPQREPAHPSRPSGPGTAMRKRGVP